MRLQVPATLALIATCIVTGCSSNEVAANEFMDRYKAGQEINTMKWDEYLGEKDGYAYINHGHMNMLLLGTTETIIKTKIADLPEQFRNNLPQRKLEAIPLAK